MVRPNLPLSVGGPILCEVPPRIDLDQCALPSVPWLLIATVLAMAFASEAIMAMQSNDNGSGGLANNLTLQLALLAATVIVILYAAAHYIW